MLHQYEAFGYGNYIEVITKLLVSTKKIVTFFCGSLNEDGNSWCPDCTSALPVIYAALGDLRTKLRVSELPEKFAFVFVSIDRDDWKGNSQFRSDETLKLTSIPTLIRWENGEEVGRIGEEECKIKEQVLPFFDL